MTLITVASVCGCGADDPPPPCEGAACGNGPRLQLEAQGEFGHIRCTGEARDCVLDFGTLALSAAAESWTVIRNVGDGRLHLAELQVSDAAFEINHPAVELDPGEQLSFRLRLRIDQPGTTATGSLSLFSDAVNGDSVSSGCLPQVRACTVVSVDLHASTD